MKYITLIICLSLISCSQNKIIKSPSGKTVEGYVTLKFSITKDGSARNPVVVNSKPKNTFDNEAIKAVLKYKFPPKIVKGKAVEYKVTQTIDFNLTDIN